MILVAEVVVVGGLEFSTTRTTTRTTKTATKTMVVVVLVAGFEEY